MSTLRLLGAFLSLFVFACGAAWSQPYPSKPVRVVVVFPAGGGTDIVSRIIFQKVSEQMNQQFIIDNRVGASGMIGGALVAKSPPDGYTLMVYSQTMLNNLHLYQKVPYELKDFDGVAMLTRIVGMLGVHPSLPVKTTKEFIALAKARPGQILYGSAGIGAFQHLATSVFANMAGIKLNHVPFKGGAPAVIALVGGEVQAFLTVIAELYPHIQSGRVRAIAVSSEKRTKQFPDVPAIAETVKGYEFTSWFGCFAPAGTAKPIIDRLSAEIKKALAEPDVLAKLDPQVLDPQYKTPEEFTQYLKAEYDRMKDVVKMSGARIE
jgi:tripartite-type tricarboxylate transporter receptor subunit TctC